MRRRPSLRGALLWFLLQGINSCCCAEQTRFWLQQLAFIRHHTHKVSLRQRLQRKLSKVTAVSPASIQLSAEGRFNLAAFSIAMAGVKRSFGLADNQRMDSRMETSGVCVCCNENYYNRATQGLERLFSKLKSNQKCKPATA